MYQPPAKLGFTMSNSVKILNTYARTFFTGSASNFSFFQWMKSCLVPSCRSVLTGAGTRRDECPRGWGGTEPSCSWLCVGLDCGVGPDNGEAPGGWHLHSEHGTCSTPPHHTQYPVHVHPCHPYSVPGTWPSPSTS